MRQRGHDEAWPSDLTRPEPHNQRSTSLHGGMMETEQTYDSTPTQ
jgi:hypothetical protein